MATASTNWKQVYQTIFDNTPKKFRRTKSQLTTIKSQAKIYIALYYQS